MPLFINKPIPKSKDTVFGNALLQLPNLHLSWEFVKGKPSGKVIVEFKQVLTQEETKKFIETISYFKK